MAEGVALLLLLILPSPPSIAAATAALRRATGIEQDGELLLPTPRLLN